MKKRLRLIIVLLTSFVLVIAMAIGIILWCVFTPEKLTSIVRGQTDKFITCKTEIGEIELTFFSTFPRAGIKIDKLTLINHMEGAPSDTLLHVEKLIGSVDFNSWWDNDELIIKDVTLAEGKINAFVNSYGKSNYNVVVVDTLSQHKPDKKSGINFIDINGIVLQNIRLNYTDLSNQIQAQIPGLSAKLGGNIQDSDLKGHIETKPFDITVSTGNDSLSMKANLQNISINASGEKVQDIIKGSIDIKPFDISCLSNGGSTNMNALLQNIAISLQGEMNQNIIHGNLTIKPFEASFEYGGEKYLDHAQLEINLPATIDLANHLAEMKEASISLNNLVISLGGTLRRDTVIKNTYTNITYKTGSWSIDKLQALVPKTYAAKLKGIDIAGNISSDGKITGIYNDSVMPLMDIHLQLDKGSLNYTALPITIHNMAGDINLYTDLKNNATSYMRINRFNAKTKNSAIKTAGTVTQLFTDPRINLLTDADLYLPEFTSLIPADMKLNMKGKATGKVKSDFLLSQMQKMQLEKMQLAGTFALSDIDVEYDSLSLITPNSVIQFELPNLRAAAKQTGFISAKINTTGLEVNKLDGYRAYVEKAQINVESSDFRDSTRIPDLFLSFISDTLSANMDTMYAALSKPAGRVSIAPQKTNPKRPDIQLVYNSGKIHAGLGNNLIDVEKIELDTRIVNEKATEDHWTVKGYADIKRGQVGLSALAFPIEIPVLKMNFEPEMFSIQEGNFNIDKSNFQLSGNLHNVQSYFKGDSLLRGKFNLTSTATDIAQLMALTNGIGHDDSTSVTKSESTSFSGPYMVPKGVDMYLNVDVDKAHYGMDTANNVKGKIQVKDGELVFDAVAFTTSAAKMQLTALYKTPRRNHLFLGLDYHMLDVEIAELLRMIPMVDTIMPMLRSFDGKGEFHTVAETFLDSLYNPKKSTMRGIFSIKGQDLVLLDSETFGKIAKTLRFSKKTENKIDSLSAEFTIFKQEIDVYPFLIVMDKYKAIVSGRHNLDMSFDYHISVIESILPIKLGVDVKVTMDDLKIKLAKRKYDDLYRPVQRRELQDSQLELRRQIREVLLKRVHR